MAQQYTTGSVTVTAGDATVTGTGTDWQNAGITSGDWLIVKGDGIGYRVNSVTNNTELELSEPYAGTTGTYSDYAISREFTPNLALVEMSPKSIGSAQAYNESMGIIDQEVSARLVAQSPGDVAGTAAVADILGTVSQFGGVPTGAIIERGSNSNGEYVKFADGTLECWQEILVSETNNNRWDSSWSFPETFSSAPNVVVSELAATGSWTNVLSDVLEASMCGSFGESTTLTNVVVFANSGYTVPTSSTGTVRAHAKGRWF